MKVEEKIKYPTHMALVDRNAYRKLLCLTKEQLAERYIRKVNHLIFSVDLLIFLSTCFMLLSFIAGLIVGFNW